MINFISDCWGVTQGDHYPKWIFRFDWAVWCCFGWPWIFPISEELTRKRATLVIPQGQNGVNQITISDVYLTKAIANRPIYIKQAFLRIECFRILQYQVSQSLIYHLDDIVKIIACICNIYPPLPCFKVKN